MGSRDDPYDDAVAETLFATVKKELKVSITASVTTT